MNPRQYNFTEYRKLLCKAYQTNDFKQAFHEGKQLYYETFEETLPFPIQEYPEDYELFCKLLESKIINEDLTDVVLISKSKVKAKFKLEEAFFDKWYSIPEAEVLVESSKELYGKKVYSKLYNENKVINILESDDYLLVLEEKRNKKSNFLN